MATPPRPWPRAAAEKKEQTKDLAKDIIQLAEEARRLISISPIECALMLSDIANDAREILLVMNEADKLTGG